MNKPITVLMNEQTLAMINIALADYYGRAVDPLNPGFMRDYEVLLTKVETTAEYVDGGTDAVWSWSI